MRKRHGNAAISPRARFVVLWADGERRIGIREKLRATMLSSPSGRARSTRKVWQAWCRCALGAPKAMASNTGATAHSACSRPSTRALVRCSGQTAARHTSVQFVGFLEEIVATQSPLVPDSRLLRQGEQPQDASGASVPDKAPARPSGLHADVLVLVEPSRELVRSYPARRHHSRHLLFHQRPRQKAHALHPPIQQEPKTVEMEVRRSVSTHHHRFF